MLVDLHTHTTFSDGTTDPETNATLAAAAGLGALAITDHDTVAHFPATQDACARHGLVWVPGLELSAEEEGRSVHLLGYWIDPDHGPLVDELERLGNERDRRNRAMVDNLNAEGVDVSYEQVEAIADGAPLGRPHLAQAIVESGAVRTIQDAFDEWLRDGGRAYEPKRALSPERAVELIVDAGGAAVLAHPGLGSTDVPIDLPLLDRLVAVGLRGVEADHPGHEAPVVAFWRSAARARDLVITGGSDFHGDRKPLKIGDACTPARVVESLRGV